MRKSRESEHDDLFEAANAAWLARARELIAAAGYIRDLSQPDKYVRVLQGDAVYYQLDNGIVGPFRVSTDVTEGSFELSWRGRRVNCIAGQAVDLSPVCKVRRKELLMAGTTVIRAEGKSKPGSTRKRR